MNEQLLSSAERNALLIKAVDDQIMCFGDFTLLQ